MAIDYTVEVYSPVYDKLARPVTIYPDVSQPDALPYDKRGIYDTKPIDVLSEAGAVFSDQVTILDILDREFTVLPLQKDRINIPAIGGIPAAGMFEIMDTDNNGGGETTLTLRKIVEAKP